MSKVNVKKATKKEIEMVEVNSLEVIRAKEFKGGNRIVDVIINGITIYGVRIVSGKNGNQFLSFPQRSGSDGKYYSIVWCPLDEDTQKAIIEEAELMIEK